MNLMAAKYHGRPSYEKMWPHLWWKNRCPLLKSSITAMKRMKQNSPSHINSCIQQEIPLFRPWAKDSAGTEGVGQHLLILSLSRPNLEPKPLRTTLTQEWRAAMAKAAALFSTDFTTFSPTLLVITSKQTHRQQNTQAYAAYPNCEAEPSPQHGDVGKD